MIKKYIMSLVVLCAPLTSLANAPIENSPWKIWSHDQVEAHYEELKEAVFTKMGNSFARLFNQMYPQSSVEAVQELAFYIDKISPWAESYPPQANALIDFRLIPLRGDIACIIYDMKPIEDSPWETWSHHFMEAQYTALKKAVFAKTGDSFARAFDQKYPKSSKEAVQELALHIDEIAPWEEESSPHPMKMASYHRQTTATIGSQHVTLIGDIARIIFAMAMEPTAKQSPWSVTPPDYLDTLFTPIKGAVFTKMGEDFTLSFNQKYPQLNKDAIEELVLHIDEVLVKDCGCPIQIRVTIGSRVIECRSHCAYMIYDAALRVPAE